MKNEAKRDIIPVLIIFLISLLGNGWNFLTVLMAIPLIYCVLYLLNLIQPTEMYVPKPPMQQSFATEMMTYSHPILMPRPLYAILGVIYMLLGIGVFLIFPLAKYFWNWASLCWKMSSTSSRVEPIGSSSDTMRSGPLPGSGTNTRTQQRPVQDGVFTQKPKDIPKTSQTKPWSQASREERTARSLEKNVILQIEKNDQELRGIRETFDEALDSIFGGSEMTKVRFQDGMDKAIKMSAENLKAAREYVRIGHNPEVLKKFLDRSNMINKETGELLDALVTHQQNQMEDNLKGLTDSLDELQDSLKYYH